MMTFIQNNIFILMALLSSTLASLSGGLIGTYVVIKRISFIAGSLSHAILGGLGICLFFQKTFGLTWLTPEIGALFTALFSAYLLGIGYFKLKEREDTLISMVWTIGMSIGIIFLAITPGGTTGDMLGYLFGNLLWAGKKEIIYLTLLFIASLYFHLKHHHKLVVLSFDEKQALLSGINVQRLFLSLLFMIGLVIIFLIKTVGAILVMSMLTIPTATVCHFAKNVKQIAHFSMMVGAFYSIVGVLLAYLLNWPLGASITLVASIGYCLVKLGAFKKLHRTDFFPKRSE
jgi:zinc transport system permease protein